MEKQICMLADQILREIKQNSNCCLKYLPIVMKDTETNKPTNKQKIENYLLHLTYIIIRISTKSKATQHYRKRNFGSAIGEKLKKSMTFLSLPHLKYTFLH